MQKTIMLVVTLSVSFIIEPKRLQPIIFFPASGNVNGSSLNNRGSNGNYWARSFNSSTNAWKLNFNSSEQNTNTNNRNNGFSVRGVLSHFKTYKIRRRIVKRMWRYYRRFGRADRDCLKLIRNEWVILKEKPYRIDNIADTIWLMK